MAYEIPQQLEYKERIIFGLTFPQVGWASVFAAIALYMLLRLPFTVMVNGALALVPLTIGILFVYFQAFEWLKRITSFLKSYKILTTSTKLNSVHHIKKINSKTLQADREIGVIEVTSINFRMKTDNEKQAILASFQKFLNSFSFPIQFLVTTQELSLDDYFEKLLNNKKHKHLADDVVNHFKALIETKKMRNRRFYLVIPNEGNLEQQIEVVLDRLQSMGLRSERLEGKKLLDMLTYVINGKDAERSFAHDRVSDLIGLKEVRSAPNYLKVNDQYCRVICAAGYPRNVESGFLDKVIALEGDIDVSLHIEPFNLQTMLVMLNRELQKQRADLYGEKLRGAINPSLEIKHKDTRNVLEQLQKGEEKLFQVSLYINCRADSVEKLDLLTRKVESELNAGMIQPHVPLFRQLDGYRSMMPVAQDYLRVRRNVPTRALSAFFPFTSPFLDLEEDGVLLGLNRNHVPVIRDIFKLSNPNGLVLATSGAGKSYFTKLLILRQMITGCKVMIIDPQSEYLGLVKASGGQVVTISRNSETIINPLDLMGHDFLEKRLSLMDLFKVMFGELTDVQKSILDRAITETYRKKGITIDKGEHRKPPTLSDLYSTLEVLSKKASTMEQITYAALLNRLYVYTSGVFNFLNKQTSINFNADVVCFNIGEMPKQVKPVVMFLILDYVYMKMKQTKDRKLLIIDEAWSLLSQTSEASYIFEIVKTCRKFNMGMLLITQDVKDLIDSRAGHAVLANTAYSLLLRQKPAVVNEVVKAFSLSPLEKEYLLSAVRGNGILITDNDHTELEIVSSEKEHALIEHKSFPVAEEIEKVKSCLLTDDFYLDKDLDKHQVNALFNAEYKVGNFTDISETVKKKYWVKCTANESAEHGFHVGLVKRELLKYTKKITDNRTVGADVVFIHRGKEYAIEVETGKGFYKHRKDKIEKFSEKQKEFGTRLYVVLTNSEMRRSYSRIFAPRKIFVKKTLDELFSSIFGKSNSGRK